MILRNFWENFSICQFFFLVLWSPLADKKFKKKSKVSWNTVRMILKFFLGKYFFFRDFYILSLWSPLGRIFFFQKLCKKPLKLIFRSIFKWLEAKELTILRFLGSNACHCTPPIIFIFIISVNFWWKTKIHSLKNFHFHHFCKFLRKKQNLRFSGSSKGFFHPFVITFTYRPSPNSSTHPSVHRPTLFRMRQHKKQKLKRTKK